MKCPHEPCNDCGDNARPTFAVLYDLVETSPAPRRLEKPMQKKKRTKSANRKPQPGIERARAWIATAINPVLEGVRSELPWLEERNFTWVHTRRDFERLAPIAAYIDPRYFDNFTDFLKRHPSLSATVERHDAHLDELKFVLARWHDVLVKGEFRNAVIHALLQERQEPERRKNVDELDSVLTSHFADHCINNRSEISDLYTWADFWRRHSAALLEIARRADPEAARSSETYARLLIEDVRTISVRFERRREELADQYGLAVVPLEHG